MKQRQVLELNRRNRLVGSRGDLCGAFAKYEETSDVESDVGWEGS